MQRASGLTDGTLDVEVWDSDSSGSHHVCASITGTFNASEAGGLCGNCSDPGDCQNGMCTNC